VSPLTPFDQSSVPLSSKACARSFCGPHALTACVWVLASGQFDKLTVDLGGLLRSFWKCAGGHAMCLPLSYGSCMCPAVAGILLFTVVCTAWYVLQKVCLSAWPAMLDGQPAGCRGWAAWPCAVGGAARMIWLLQQVMGAQAAPSTLLGAPSQECSLIDFEF
jgi:hypothetical protein